MRIHSNQRLFDLASANAQRLALRGLAESASPQLSAFLNASEPIFHPHTPASMLATLSIANAIHEGASPAGKIEVLETASQEVAKSWLLARIHRLQEGDYFVYLGGSDRITFSGRLQWLPHLPIFRSPKPVLAAAFETIQDIAQSHFAVVETNSEASLVLDSYLGVLPNEPSPDEIVYELSFAPSDG